MLIQTVAVFLALSVAAALRQMPHQNQHSQKGLKTYRKFAIIWAPR